MIFATVFAAPFRMRKIPGRRLTNLTIEESGMKRKSLSKWVLTGCIAVLSVTAAAAQDPFAAATAPGDTIALTLDDALRMALSENLTVRVADREITKSQYARKGTYAALFPQINFTGDYQRNIKKQVMYMGDQAIKFGRDNTWSLGFGAGLPIIDVSLWKAIQITGMDVELAVEKARSSRVDLIDQVQQAFYAALLAMDSYQVYRENYDQAVSNYEDVKKKYESGKTSRYDLIRAEVTMQNAMPGVYQAQNSIIVTQWQLKALIGMDLELNIRCVGSLADYQALMERVSVLEEVPLDENPDLKQLRIQESMLEKTYRMQAAKYYPTLNLSINYQWSAMTENFRFSTFRWNPFSVGGLSLTIPIFSGGQRFFTLKQTRVQQDQLRMQVENAERNLNVAVRQYLSQMETSQRQYEAAAKSMEGAETGYRISQKRYEIGSGTLLELNDAQLALLQAKLNLNQAVYSYLTAKSSLDKTLGVNIERK